MTMLIRLMIEAAEKLVQGWVAIAVEKVRAFRWLVVAPPADVTLTASFKAEDLAQVKIGEYAEGLVRLARHYPSPPAPTLAQLIFREEQAVKLSPSALYADKWMFHGPQYQGIVGLGPEGSDGIRGELVCQGAPGALLDNVFQLMGYWIMVHTTRDRIAFPVAVNKVTFYGPHPPPRQLCQGTVQIKEVTASEVVADAEVTAGGKLWAKIEAWQDKRLESDEATWSVLMSPANSLLSRCQEDYALVHEHCKSAGALTRMGQRYLSERETRLWEGAGPRKKRGWLLGRIAVKDAVRHWLWNRGAGPLYPAEIEVFNHEDGTPYIEGSFSPRLFFSLAQEEDCAVARVAPLREVAVALEKIDGRSPSFVPEALSEAERKLLAAAKDKGQEEEFWARAVAAKKVWCTLQRAAIKPLPPTIAIGDATAERLFVEGRWIETKREGNYIVAWA
jgi:hypothetical protein